MKRLLTLLAAGLVTILWAGQATADSTGKKKPSILKPSQAETCGDHGTSVHFEPNPSAAARKAQKEEKLVLVLHISGLFENSDFT
ncbi:MAG: hypothetical protein FJ271_14735 [Planctomycetes bacterium]|nr:hypothetical protein [Planctomycetota bacterium]